MLFDAKVAKLLQPGQHLTVTGYPGLRLKATETTRTWLYRYKSPVDGKMRQVKIGAWPALSVAAAIVRWEELRNQRDSGVDHAAQRRTERVVQAKEKAAQKEADRLDALTVRGVCDFYWDGYVKQRRQPKGQREVKRLFDKMLGDLGDVVAVNLTRKQCYDFLHGMSGTPVLAMNLRRELSAAWFFALDAGLLPPDTANYWRDILRNYFKSKGRKIKGDHVGTGKRVLSEEELGILVRWLPNFTEVNRDMLTLYLWTCTRGAELCNMHESEITEEKDGWWWTIPKAKTKNRHRDKATDLRVPLVGRALEVVQRRLQRTVNGYLFTGLKGLPLEQKVVGVAVWNARPDNEALKSWERPRLPLANWTPHDLRRSSRSLLPAMGCDEDLAERVIGHVIPGPRGVYNIYAYDDERRLWLTRLSERLEQLAATPAQAS